MAGGLDQAAGCFPQPAEAQAPALLCCLVWEAGRAGRRHEEGVISGLRTVTSSTAADVSYDCCLSTAQSYSRDLTQSSTTKLTQSRKSGLN